MSAVTPPPLYDPIADEGGIASPSWTQFFNAVFVGDTGRSWEPTFTGLSVVGTIQTTGKFYKISKNLVYFRVEVTPASASNTSSVAGTTYIDNFPLNIRGAGACISLSPSTGTGGAIGVAVPGSNRIFTPQWTTVSSPVIIVGMMEAQ